MHVHKVQQRAGIRSHSSTEHGCNVCKGKYTVALSVKIRDSKMSETRPPALTSNRICLSRQCIQSHCAFMQVRTGLSAPSSLIARAKSFPIYPRPAIRHPQSPLSPKARYEIFIIMTLFWSYAEHASVGHTISTVTHHEIVIHTRLCHLALTGLHYAHILLDTCPTILRCSCFWPLVLFAVCMHVVHGSKHLM